MAGKKAERDIVVLRLKSCPGFLVSLSYIGELVTLDEGKAVILHEPIRCMELMQQDGKTVCQYNDDPVLTRKGHVEFSWDDVAAFTTLDQQTDAKVLDLLEQFRQQFLLQKAGLHAATEKQIAQTTVPKTIRRQAQPGAR